MPIHNSKVPSTELMAKRRARRLNKGQSPQEDVADPIDPVSSLLTGPGEDAQKYPHGDSAKEPVRGEPSARAQEEQGIPTALPDDHAQKGELDASEERAPAMHEIKPDPSKKRQLRKGDRITPEQQSETGAIKLHMRLPVPAAGASPTFDQLAETHGEQSAFRLVLGKALELYAASVVGGSAGDAPTPYPEGSTVMVTTRNVPQIAYAILSKEMNSKGLVSRRMMGTAIARRALAAFVADDTEHG